MRTMTDINQKRRFSLFSAAPQMPGPSIGKGCFGQLTRSFTMGGSGEIHARTFHTLSRDIQHPAHHGVREVLPAPEQEQRRPVRSKQALGYLDK